MKWIGRRESSNVEDRRGFSGGGLAVGGGIIGVIVILLKVFLGGDASSLPEAMPQAPAQELSAEEQKLDDERASFIKVVLADTEDVWNKLFSGSRESYVEPTLVLFRQSVQSACGMAGSATGPFYCPG